MVLFGRDRELARIRALIRTSPESALAISGSRGSGKSALLAEITQLHGFRTVAFRASPSESSWPSVGLAALFSGLGAAALIPALEHVTTVPGTQADLPAVSSALLAALRQQSGTRTVVVVDDADNLDPGSQAVLGFLARRLAGTGIVLIVSLSGESPESPFAHLASLHISDLNQDDAVRMLESIPAAPLNAAAIHAVAAATQGNPLAAIELFEELVRRQLQGQYALPFPLSWTGSFETEHAAAISGLSPGARGALEILSLSYRSSAAVLERMAGDFLPGLDEILAAGLAVRSGSQLTIRNQMLRGHVFSAMPPERRAACHQALAAIAETVDPVAWPWHLSYVPKAPRDISVSLLRLAVRLVRAGEMQSAVEYVERALMLSPREAETAAGLGTLARILFSRGEFVHAKRYLRWARRITKNRALALRLSGLDFQIELMKGSPARPGMVLRLAAESGHHDPAFSACLLSVGALYLADRWQIGDAMRLLEHAEQFPGPASGEARAVGQRARLLAGAVTGGPERIPQSGDGGSNSPLVSLLLAGRAHSYREDYEEARDLFALVRSLGTASDANWSETARYFAADNEIRAGNFRSAIALIDDIAASAASRQYHRGMRNSLLLWRAFAVGDALEAQSRLAEAQSSAGAGSSPQASAQLIACQGQFALLHGSLPEAVALLGRAAEIGADFPNPALLRCEPDLIEALARSGYRREAARTLAKLESRSAGLKSRWLRMALSRSQALVAEGDASLGLFAQALAAPQKDDSVFERARTLLCYAAGLTASGKPNAARNSLLGAKTLFDEIGATAWAQQAAGLLAGGHAGAVPEFQNPALVLLSDHELELVHLVAKGRRNKEIAASLYVSVRTVEVRLTAIYRKLGIQSRSHLAFLAATRERLPAFASAPLSGLSPG